MGIWEEDEIILIMDLHIYTKICPFFVFFFSFLVDTCGVCGHLDQKINGVTGEATSVFKMLPIWLMFVCIPLAHQISC